MKGLQLAMEQNFRSVIIESDSQELVKAAKTNPWNGNWLLEIRKLSASFNSVLWNWVSRQANGAADSAAKLAKSRLCALHWLNAPLTFMVAILSRDGLPAPHRFFFCLDSV